MEIDGWTISADARQFITKKDGDQFYHMNLENALYDICERTERRELVADLGSVVTRIKQMKTAFYQSLMLVTKGVSTGVYRSRTHADRELEPSVL